MRVRVPRAPSQCFTTLAGEYSVSHGDFHPDRNYGRLTLGTAPARIDMELVKARNVLCNYRGCISC